jgi:hypothetical protein
MAINLATSSEIIESPDFKLNRTMRLRGDRYVFVKSGKTPKDAEIIAARWKAMGYTTCILWIRCRGYYAVYRKKGRPNRHGH